WSSDVCSSDLTADRRHVSAHAPVGDGQVADLQQGSAHLVRAPCSCSGAHVLGCSRPRGSSAVSARGSASQWSRRRVLVLVSAARSSAVDGAVVKTASGGAAPPPT